MKPIYYLIIFTIIFFGCKTKKVNNVFVKDINPIHLKGETVHVTNGCYSQIVVYDTILYLIDQCGTNYFQLFNKNNYNRILSFGKKGKGPDEFMNPQFIITSFSNKGKETFFRIYNVNQKVIQLHCLNDILSKNYYPKKIMKLDPKILGGFQFNFLNDTIIIGNDHVYGKGLIFFYNINNKKIRWIDFVPVVRNLPRKDKIPIMYNIFIAKNKKNRKIAVAYNYFNRLSIFDYAGNLKTNINIGDDLIIPDFNENTKYVIPHKVKIHFEDILVSNKYIYALYQNITQKKMVSFPNEKDIDSKIFIFNWKGELLYAYSLGTYIYTFGIDETKHLIYGLSYDDRGYSILFRYKYNNNYE